MINGVAKKMQKTKSYVTFLIALLLVGLFTFSPAISSIMDEVTIRSIGTIMVEMRTAYRSEVRGVFFHGANYGHNRMEANWTLIAQTCHEYGVTDAFVDLGGLPDGDLRTAMLPEILNAFHPLGIKVHVSWNLLIGGRTSPEDMRAIKYDGTPVYWGCPTKQATRDFIKNVVQKIASYDIDGFMFDYARYATAEICYCSECKEKFQEWLGENVTDWTPFYPDGARYNEYLNWRCEPITELVSLVREWMLDVNPDLEFSAAVWPLGDDCPIYWKKFLGQDTADWIRNSYLNFVCPMQYTNNVDEVKMRIRDQQKYWTAGKEGQLPMYVLVTNGINELYTVDEFKAVVDAVREAGADGWIVWRYGGPGNYPGDNRTDIRPYLEALEMPETFILSNIKVSVSQTEAIINWITNKPTTSKVEYNTSMLFNWSLKSSSDIYYWYPEYIPGNIIENNETAVFHEITLENLLPGTKYYFRVQSKGESGIVTSKVLIFTTKS